MIRNEIKHFDVPHFTKHLNEGLIENNTSSQKIVQLFQNG